MPHQNDVHGAGRNRPEDLGDWSNPSTPRIRRSASISSSITAASLDSRGSWKEVITSHRPPPINIFFVVVLLVLSVLTLTQTCCLYLHHEDLDLEDRHFYNQTFNFEHPYFCLIYLFIHLFFFLQWTVNKFCTLGGLLVEGWQSTSALCRSYPVFNTVGLFSLLFFFLFFFYFLLFCGWQ